MLPRVSHLHLRPPHPDGVPSAFATLVKLMMVMATERMAESFILLYKSDDRCFVGVVDVIMKRGARCSRQR